LLFDLKCYKPVILFYFELNALTLFVFCIFFWLLFFHKFEIVLYYKKQKQQQLLFFNFKEKLNQQENLNYLEDFRVHSPNFFVHAFYDLFQELETLFTLNNLDLNFSERQILAYCLMGYTYKEIAQFTNSSFKSVESKKYRLKQKLERVNLLFILN